MAARVGLAASSMGKRTTVAKEFKNSLAEQCIRLAIQEYFRQYLEYFEVVACGMSIICTLYLLGSDVILWIIAAAKTRRIAMP